MANGDVYKKISGTWTLIANISGPQGASGTGSPGAYGGSLTFDYIFDTGTSNADPGTGKFRVNAAITATATALYVDTTSNDNINLATVLDNLTNSTNPNKAIIRIANRTDVTKFALFYITSETTHTGYREYAITSIAYSSPTPFNSGDECLLLVDQIGDKGNTGSGADMVKIQQQTLVADVSSVVFSGFASTYSHLMLVCMGRLSESATSDYVYLRFNSDAGANYDYQHANFFSNSSSTPSNYAQNQMRVGAFEGTTAARSTQAGAFKVLIPFYTNTSWEKVAIAEGGDFWGTSGTGQETTRNAGAWRSTSAITVVQLIPGGGNFKAGSLFALYGIN